MIELLVPADEAGQRLDRFLAARSEMGSRSRVQRLIADARVTLNGAPAKAGAILRTGDRIAVGMQPPDESSGPGGRALAEDIPLDVLYEDEDLLVIHKPAGLVVHPAPGHWRGTLVSALLHRWRGPRPGLDELRPGIVHRLDRETSGVLVIGKTPEVVARLAAQFKSREVEKEYLAVVWRAPRPRSGVIDKPVGRHPKRRQRMAIRRDGRAAVTSYETIEEFGDLAVLRLRPETGRTHQLRVHLASIGHPILGDKVYGRARNVRDPRLRDFSRQALHAARLSFGHPADGRRLSFEAPLPADLEALLEHLRAR